MLPEGWLLQCSFADTQGRFERRWIEVPRERDELIQAKWVIVEHRPARNIDATPHALTDAEVEAVKTAGDALLAAAKAQQQMRSRTKPKKLDESLRWIENDELADKMLANAEAAWQDAITAYLARTQAQGVATERRSPNPPVPDHDSRQGGDRRTRLHNDTANCRRAGDKP